MSDGDALRRANTLIKANRTAEAIPILEGLVSADNADAALLLGEIYRIGFATSWMDKALGRQNSDPQKAKAAFDKAVSLGHPVAQAIMARAYFEGIEGSLVFRDFDETQEKQDFSEAYFWACRAVNNKRFCFHTPYAYSLLAELYASGLGCQRDQHHAALLRAIADEYRKQLLPNNKQSFIPLRPRPDDLPGKVVEKAREVAVKFVNSDRLPISHPSSGRIFSKNFG